MTKGTPRNDNYAVAGAVVVGIDGSDSSKRALTWAFEQARATARPLVAITTWDWTPPFGGIGGWPGEVNLEDEARRVLDESIEKAIGPDQAPSVRRMVVHGRPALVLEDASREAEVLVVGSRGHGEIAGMVLGSVSEFLATHAHCPVVIIRQD